MFGPRGWNFRGPRGEFLDVLDEAGVSVLANETLKKYKSRSYRLVVGRLIHHA